MAARPVKPVRPISKVAVSRPAQQSSSKSKDPPKELTFGNVKVGPSGIEFVDGSVLPEGCVNIDSLDFKKELGMGAQGSVALYCERANSSVKFAVKSINLNGKDSQGISKVAAEIRNIFTQRSPYVVALHNAFVREGKLLLVMEFMDWGNMEELQEVTPQLSEGVSSYIACQLLNSLALLHSRHRQVDADTERRQIHRDIKPANLLLSKEGIVKLADFGVAASAETVGVASFVGTATYMSPERIKGQRYGTASDIWSVGIVVAQALLGRYPFASAGSGFMALLKEVTTVENLELPGCSAEAQDFVNHCLCQEEADRWSAQQLLEHPWVIAYNGTEAAPNNAGQQALVNELSKLGDIAKHDMSASMKEKTDSGVSGSTNTGAGAPNFDIKF